MNQHPFQPVRDEELGELLRALDVPQHGPEFHTELRRRLRDERTRGRRRRGTRVAAVVAVAAAAVVALGLLRGHGPQAADAAVVKTRVRAALATVRRLSGVLVATGPRETDGGRWRFALDAAGDLRLEGPRPGDVQVYDAASGVVRSAQHSVSAGGDTLFYAERTGVAPGPPDPGPPTWVLPEQYATLVRAALADNPASVAETTYAGRPAWRLDVETTPSLAAPGDRLAIVVDRASGMPVRVTESKDGAVLRELRIEELAVDPPLPASTFRLDFPAGAEVLRSDDGFRRMPLDRVAAAAGYRPLVPAWVPDGYRLAEVAVAGHAVSLSYRRGIDQFLVTTRPRDDRPPADASPHLWTTRGGLLVTVGGDVTRAELARIAGSL
jgi:hypothetical protein